MLFHFPLGINSMVIHYNQVKLVIKLMQFCLFSRYFLRIYLVPESFSNRLGYLLFTGIQHPLCWAFENCKSIQSHIMTPELPFLWHK